MAWRCRFLTARQSQDVHSTHWLISTQVPTIVDVSMLLQPVRIESAKTPPAADLARFGGGGASSSDPGASSDSSESSDGKWRRTLTRLKERVVPSTMTATRPLERTSSAVTAMIPFFPL